MRDVCQLGFSHPFCRIKLNKREENNNNAHTYTKKDTLTSLKRHILVSVREMVEI